MTTPGEEPVRAGIYCRMSLAEQNDTTKVDDQERICRLTAERLDWEVIDVYQDNNKSAWKYNRKRPEWDRMLADIEAGRINAIVVYHGDRLTRQPMDLEMLFALSRTRGIKLAAGTGVHDLNNDDDQFVLGIVANVYRKESAATSRRRKDQYARWRREGRVSTGGPGGRAFGFEPDGLTHRAAETAILAEASERILAGHSVRSVTTDLAERGIRTPAGNLLPPTTLKRILMNPRMAGLMPDGESKAAWEPVLDRAEWEDLRAVLSSHPRNPAGGGRVMYLLSGIARCHCGHVMYAGENRSYRCPRPIVGGCGKVRRSRRLLDAYVTSSVVARLARSDNPDPRAMPTPALATEFRLLAAARAETAAAVADPAHSGRLQLLLARLDSQDARLAVLRALSESDARSRLHTRYAGITEEEFEALPLPVQRSLVSAFLDITVLPASKRGPGLRLEDLRVIPR